MGANPNNIGGQIVAVQATANASATSAQTGSAIDRIGFSSGKLVISRGAATGTPSSQTTDAKLQHSDTTTSGDFVDYTQPDGTAAAITQDTTATAKVITLDVNLVGAKRYVRAVVTPALSGGSSPAFPLGSVLVLGGAAQLPAVAN